MQKMMTQTHPSQEFEFCFQFYSTHSPPLPPSKSNSPLITTSTYPNLQFSNPPFSSAFSFGESRKKLVLILLSKATDACRNFNVLHVILRDYRECLFFFYQNITYKHCLYYNYIIKTMKKTTKLIWLLTFYGLVTESNF